MKAAFAACMIFSGSSTNERAQHSPSASSLDQDATDSPEAGE
jgi:hypothetical protein